MELESVMRGGDLLVSIAADRLDAAVAVQFRDGMRASTEGGPARVVLDMSQVQFLDSSGLGAVVAVMKQLGPDRRLDLMAVTPSVQKVLRLTRMDTVFRVFDDDASAFGTIAHAS